MIYVSTSCHKCRKIEDSVKLLAQAGYRNIELSGGSEYYEGYLDDLQTLRDKFSLKYLVHNYFPVPESHFMLNLATLDHDLYRRSIQHCKKAISLCRELGSDKYAIHAGFLIDFSPEESGKKIGFRELNERNAAIIQFCEAWELLTEYAKKDVKLYIENNVYSQTNKRTYKDLNPFLLTDYDGYVEMRERIDFGLLLDLAHLKVSCNSLRRSFDTEIEKMLPITDYYHLSGNDGLHDQNRGLASDHYVCNLLDQLDPIKNTITLEVYDGPDSLRNSYNIVQDR